MDKIVLERIPKIRKEVLKHDKDKIFLVDGREGCGKSTFAQQLARELDPDFNIDKITFTADEFIREIKSPKRKKGDCIILDEAFTAINSRQALSQVNRAMVGVATEMRQLNLFVIICLPSFFDLDKYFAIWRSDILFHLYFDKKTGERGRYIIFPFKKKLQLYLNGKKTYSYAKPHSPYPPCRFNKEYVVDEIEYRKRKALAFKKRVVSNLALRWKGQRNAVIKEMYHNLNISSSKFEKIFVKWGIKPVSQREIQRIVQLGNNKKETLEEDREDIEEDIKKGGK